MTDAELAAQQPANIDEALVCMRRTLDQFHRHRDKRAVFLRVYYIMTLEVHAAIRQLGDYKEQIFYDPDWVFRLSGKFSSLYFCSLASVEPTVSRAWEEAYRVAADRRSSIVQNALHGINAHINYDLPRAIADNLDPNELDDPRILQLRKFDHDQVNNLLVRTLEPVQRTLARDYDPGIGMADRMLEDLDEWLSKVGLKHYRERVWWDAMAFAAARTEGNEHLVRDKLNWESYKIALFLEDKGRLWRMERMMGRAVFWRRRRPWDQIELDQPGGVQTTSRTPINVVGATK